MNSSNSQQAADSAVKNPATVTLPLLEDRLVSFLCDPASYLGQATTVELIQTHISYVALTDGYAYKVARAVDLGFVDFSTLEKRRLNAHRAIELNRRLCPDVYLDVVPILEHQGSLRFANKGESGDAAVEYAVRMRRMPDEGFLDRRLREDRVRSSDWDRLITMLVEFYRRQPAEKVISENACPGNLRGIVFANIEPAVELHNAGISPATVVALLHYYRQYFDKQAQLLARRVEQGWIRDGHGDLRPEHIHLSTDRVRAFDCIEFSDRLRHVDVAADIAFLAMELDYTGHTEASRRVCAALADALGDREQSDVLDFYKCYRACVRGRVAVIHAQDARAHKAESEARRLKAQAYYRLALNYATHGSTPILLAVMGRVATGKTTLGNQLSVELGCEAYHSDTVRKQLAGLPMAERPTESMRRDLYAPAMTDRTYARLLQLAEQHLRNGNSVILDATFSQNRHRAMMQDLSQAVCCDLCLFELEAPDDLILARLREREGQYGVVSDARTEDFARLSAAYESPFQIPGNNLIHIESHQPEASVVQSALLALVERNVVRVSGPDRYGP